jgi:hypothetical protein
VIPEKKNAPDCSGRVKIKMRQDRFLFQTVFTQPCRSACTNGWAGKMEMTFSAKEKRATFDHGACHNEMRQDRFKTALPLRVVLSDY